MTATSSNLRLRAIVAGLIAALVTVAVIAAAPAPADAQEVEDGLEQVEDELDSGGGGEPDDPTEDLDGQDPTEELDGEEDVEQPGDGGDGGDEVDAQQLEDALAGLEEAVNDALGDNADEGGQEACETALESFLTDPAEESFESALQTCLDAIGDGLELDDETLQDCQTDFEGFLSDPSEETLQAAVDACLQSLLDLADSEDGGDPEPDAGAEPGQDDGRQVDEVPGAVQTGGTGTPTDGAQAAAAVALFAGLTAAGTALGRRRLGGA